VVRCRVDIHDHFIAEDISRQVNEGDVGAAPAWLESRDL